MPQKSNLVHDSQQGFVLLRGLGTYNTTVPTLSVKVQSVPYQF